MKRYILYSGKDCHLCDHALLIIQQYSMNIAQQIEKIDVKSSAELYHLYGARIPVLKEIDNGVSRELAWPYDLQTLGAFLA